MNAHLKNVNANLYRCDFVLVRQFFCFWKQKCSRFTSHCTRVLSPIWSVRELLMVFCQIWSWYLIFCNQWNVCHWQTDGQMWLDLSRIQNWLKIYIHIYVYIYIGCTLYGFFIFLLDGASRIDPHSLVVKG